MSVAAEPGPPSGDAPFTVARTFDVPRDRMWRVWTETEHLKRWWGPKGFTVQHCEIDLRPDGTFLYCLRAPGGIELWGKWAFREIAAPKRMVYVSSFSDPSGGVTRNPWSAEWPLETLATVSFVEEDGRTTVTVTWAPLNATEAERRTFAAGYPSMRQGWAGTFEQLATYLKETSP